MRLQSSEAKIVALILLSADIVFGDPLTVLQPCKEGATEWPAITVTSQYQPVSTCQATTACTKGKCSTIYPFTTYPFVSTVVPCAWNRTTTRMSTVTDVTQPLRVSEHLETLTIVTAAPTNRRHGLGSLAKDKSETNSITLYETVTKRAVAPFNQCGSLAIPGWGGSGLCKKCDLPDGSAAQLVDVVECRSGVDATGKSYEQCAAWYETWISRPAPTSTVTASARCSSHGKISSAGIYTWTFPQTAPPVTVTAPPKTVTATIGGRKIVTVDSKSVQTIPGRHWNACVTNSFSEATTFEFDVFVTKVIIFEFPKHVLRAKNTRNIPVPTGAQGKHGDRWWPLSNKNSGDSYYGGDRSKHWAYCAPRTKIATVTNTDSTSRTYASSPTTSYTSSQSPIYRTTSTSASIISTPSTPLAMSISTSSASSFMFSLGPIVRSTNSASISNASFSLGPVIRSIFTSTSSTSPATTSTRAIDSPIGTTTTTTPSKSSFSSNPVNTFTTTSSSTTSFIATTSLSTTTISVSTTSAITTISSTTSSALTTTTTATGPICNLNVNICLNSQLITANTVVTQGCPLGIGLICTLNQLLSLVAQVVTNNPAVLSTVVGNNQVLGLSITPQQIQAGILDGSLTSVCNTLGTTSVVVNDRTCPINQVTTTSSTRSTSSIVSSTTSSTSATTSTPAAGPICNLAISICPNSGQLAAATITTVQCPLGIGLLCTLGQLRSLVPQLLQSNPNTLSVILGQNQVLGLNISPEQVQILALSGALTSTCVVIQQVNVLVSDPTCP